MRTTLRGRRNRFTWNADLWRSLRLGDDQWHDGRLVGLSLETAHRGRRTTVEVTLRVEVYGDGPRRMPLTLAVGGVREVVTTLNCRQLGTLGDDHIVFARLNESSELLDLSIHLDGGHIRIVAEHLAVSTRLVRRRRARQP
jgi:hypothetical protein